LTPSSHPLGNEAALIFGHGSANLQEELVVWILAHGVIDELNVTAPAFQFFHE